MAEVLNQENPNSQDHSGNKLSDLRKNRLLVLAVAIVLALAAIGAVVAYNNRDNKPANANLGDVNANNVVVSGNSDNSTITFEKPDDLVYVVSPDSSNPKNYVKLTVASDDKTYTNVARIRVGSNPFDQNQTLTQDQINEIKAIIEQDINSEEFKSSFGNTFKFVGEAFVEPGINITYKNAQAFTNPSIKSNAWQFDVETSASSDGMTKAQKGKLLWIAGEKAYYRFLYTQEKSAWDAGTDDWQKVLDSIKIDQ